jgi:hypothetical protein
MLGKYLYIVILTFTNTIYWTQDYHLQRTFSLVPKRSLGTRKKPLGRVRAAQAGKPVPPLTEEAGDLLYNPITLSPAFIDLSALGNHGHGDLAFNIRGETHGDFIGAQLLDGLRQVQLFAVHFEALGLQGLGNHGRRD